MANSHHTHPSAKVLTRDALQDAVGVWKNQGKKIVFTNGCFDLLHRGHIQYLYEAAELGDVLVVGINSDESVSDLKGPGRPIQDEISRSELIASLGFVAATSIFGEDTPLNLIQIVQPDFLVKGGDYTVETVVGAEEVMSYGGQVCLLSFLPGYSTSKLEKKIKSQEH